MEKLVTIQKRYIVHTVERRDNPTLFGQCTRDNKLKVDDHGLIFLGLVRTFIPKIELRTPYLVRRTSSEYCASRVVGRAMTAARLSERVMKSHTLSLEIIRYAISKNLGSPEYSGLDPKRT